MDDSAEAKELIQQARNTDTVTARLAVDLSQKNPFYSVAYDDPIAQVVILLHSLLGGIIWERNISRGCNGRKKDSWYFISISCRCFYP